MTRMEVMANTRAVASMACRWFVPSVLIANAFLPAFSLIYPRLTVDASPAQRWL